MICIVGFAFNSASEFDVGQNGHKYRKIALVSDLKGDDCELSFVYCFFWQIVDPVLFLEMFGCIDLKLLPVGNVWRCTFLSRDVFVLL